MWRIQEDILLYNFDGVFTSYLFLHSYPYILVLQRASSLFFCSLLLYPAMYVLTGKNICIILPLADCEDAVNVASLSIHDNVSHYRVTSHYPELPGYFFCCSLQKRSFCLEQADKTWTNSLLLGFIFILEMNPWDSEQCTVSARLPGWASFLVKHDKIMETVSFATHEAMQNFISNLSQLFAINWVTLTFVSFPTKC